MAETNTKPCRVVVLISGSGSNLQALIDGQHRGELPIDIVAVISNRPDAYGLTRSQQANISSIALDHKNFSDREQFDQALAEHIDSVKPDLLVLAGFMRILTPEFVRRYQGKMVNIHPSLLPKYPGLNTHQRALDAGDTLHGTTVHFVTEELDGGPAIIQAHVPVLSNDTADSLAKRVQAQEHIIYPMAVDWFARGQLSIISDTVYLDGQALERTGYQLPTSEQIAQ